MKVLIAGCGWLGRAIGASLVARGDRVVGVTRSGATDGALLAAGIEPRRADLLVPADRNGLPVDLDAVVACQAASGDGPEAYRRAYVAISRALLAAWGTRVRSWVYTGSTGVFGYDDGRVCDETTPPLPRRGGAEALVEAEGIWLDAAAAGRPARIVRLSGLYGPDRLGVIERVRSGAMALGPGDEAWTNWCHRDDAVAMVIAALDRGRAGAIYHASDAEPARRSEVVRWIAGRIGIEPPVASTASATPRGAGRRIDGSASRAELGLTLRHPSFRDGLTYSAASALS